jgi:hypothetical protein
LDITEVSGKETPQCVRERRRSEKVLLVLSGKSDGMEAGAKKIGPTLIFERPCKEHRIDTVLLCLLKERVFGLDVERAVFLTALNRLFASGSDRFCDERRRGHIINGVDGLSIHHLYRVMAFLGEEPEDQRDHTFSPALLLVFSALSCDPYFGMTEETNDRHFCVRVGVRKTFRSVPRLAKTWNICQYQSK